MKNKILFSSLVLSLSLNAMQGDDEVQQITDELLLASRSKYEKRVKDLLHHQPFKENPGYFDYLKIADLCSPQYASLLQRLLEKKIVKPNTSFSSNGITLNLLSEAVHFSIYFSTDFTPKNRLNAVKVLLEAGAHTNKACVPYKALNEKPSEWEVRDGNAAVTPLTRAIILCDEELASLLLQYHGTKDSISYEMTPIMHALGRYVGHKKACGMSGLTISEYKMVELLVKFGADLNIPSKYEFEGNKVCTPMQLACESGCTEIVALFEKYQTSKK